MTDATNDDQRHHAATDQLEDRLPLDLSQPVILIVHNPNGDVVIRATDRSDALIRNLKRGQPGSPRYDAAELIVHVDNNQIEVRPRIPGVLDWATFGVNVHVENLNPFKRGVAWAEANAGTIFAEAGQALASAGKVVVGALHDDVGYDLLIELPRAAPTLQVAVHTASGDISVADISGPITLNSASGDLRTRHTDGEINAHTSSGDLLIEGVTGRVTARTISGDARVTAAHLDAIDLHSVSGDILVHAALHGDASSQLQSVSGDVRLSLSPEQGAEPSVTLTLKSISGDATVAAPFRKIDRRTWQLGEGTHGPRLHVQTVSGDLEARVEPLPPAPPSPPQARAVDSAPPSAPNLPTLPTTPPPSASAVPPPPTSSRTTSDASLGEGSPQPPAADATRLAVLQAVERGEIDVEEALRRLDPEPDPEP